MRRVDNGGTWLMTQSIGSPQDPAMLLVMGATESMLGWPDAFCAALAARGLFVIRFDHRDTGRSTTVPPGAADYAAEDMAGDAWAILDAYGLGRAHLTGMSLGGYLAQMMAVTRPDRVASLTLIASEPLGWDGAPLPHISDAFLAHFGTLATLDWSDEAAVAAFLLTSGRLCAGSGDGFDEAAEQARIARVLSRTDSIASMFNHAAATTRQDWTGRFRAIACPTLVVHGAEDPILPVANGTALAAGIPGAVLQVLAGVGHAIPAALVPAIAHRITEHAIRAI